MTATTSLVSTCNIAGRYISFEDPLLALGVAALAASEVRTSNNVQVPNPTSLKVHLFASITSGAYTVKISKHSGTPNFGAPTASFTLNSSSGPTADWADVSTDSVNTMFAIQLTDGGAGSVQATGGVYLLGFFAAPKFVSYHNAETAFNGMDLYTNGADFSVALT